MSELLNVLRSAVSTNDSIAESLGGIEKLFDLLDFPLTVSANRGKILSFFRLGSETGSAALRAAPNLDAEPSDDDPDLQHVAEQRAMRVVLVGRGDPITATSFHFSPVELGRIEALKRAWLTGFHDGFRESGRKRARHRYVGGN